jgi:hypothetical protein
MSQNWRFLVSNSVFVRCRVGEQTISACVVPTVKHGGGGVMVWGCFASDTVCVLFRIQGTLNQDGYLSILQRYGIQSGLRLTSLGGVDVSVAPGQHPVKLQSAKFKNRNTHYKSSWNIQVLYMGLKVNFLLIQPRCQVSKRLHGESIPWDYLRRAPSRQIITNSSQPSRVTQVRNSDKMNHLPLMIFICLHSQDSHLLNKCTPKTPCCTINVSFVR